MEDNTYTRIVYWKFITNDVFLDDAHIKRVQAYAWEEWRVRSRRCHRVGGEVR